MPIPWGFLRAGELSPEDALKVLATCRCANILITPVYLAVAHKADDTRRASQYAWDRRPPHSDFASFRSLGSPAVQLTVYEEKSKHSGLLKLVIYNGNNVQVDEYGRPTKARGAAGTGKKRCGRKSQV